MTDEHWASQRSQPPSRFIRISREKFRNLTPKACLIGWFSSSALAVNRRGIRDHAHVTSCPANRRPVAAGTTTAAPTLLVMMVEQPQRWHFSTSQTMQRLVKCPRSGIPSNTFVAPGCAARACRHRQLALERGLGGDALRSSSRNGGGQLDKWAVQAWIGEEEATSQWRRLATAFDDEELLCTTSIAVAMAAALRVG